MNSQTQAPNRKFFEDFATRLTFIRKRRGVSLEQLGGGKASTAKSWETGTRPRPDQWEQIAAKLQLSVSFIFLGEPKSQKDYEFLATHRGEIPGADKLLPPQTAAQRAFAADEDDEFGPDQRRHLKSGGHDAPHVGEAPASYESVASRIPQQRSPSTREDCEAYVRQLLDRAQISEDPNAWPVILHRLKKQFPLDEWELSAPDKEPK